MDLLFYATKKMVDWLIQNALWIILVSLIIFLIIFGVTQTIRYLKYGLKPWEQPHECLDCIKDFTTLEELNKHECKEEDLLEF